MNAIGILQDEQLVELLNRDAPIIDKATQMDWPSDPYGKHSAVQPSSIDLHIGKIFQPGAKPNERGGAERPIENGDGLVLGAGHSAIVMTKERFALPPDIGGFGFPPSRLSFKGLLMTNPGHVDPGSHMPLHFAVINMGKRPIVLRPGDVIFTILLYRLSSRATKDLSEREPDCEKEYEIRDALENLSSDFLSVEQRAERIARKQVRRAKIVAGLATLLVPILSGIIIWAVLTGMEKTSQIKEQLDEVRQQTTALQAQLNLTELESRIDHLEALLPQAGKLTTTPNETGDTRGNEEDGLETQDNK